ncbi:50S ribosomal protein L35 [Candidatus Parcubacteria bacterium]|nr:50S ribosomal protein L35 [Candidatus Parcubacteria bacterium]
MKIKTRKAITKRFKVTKKGKVIARTANQDHFNSRESGNTTRQKRSDKQITSGVKKSIKRQLAK